MGDLIHLAVHEHWNGRSLQDLFRNVWRAPKKLVHELRMNRLVAVNGAAIAWTTALQTNDSISIHLPDEVIKDIAPTPFPLDILFEDNHLLIVNKPAGMSTHPNVITEHDTLSNAVAYYMQKQDQLQKPRHVHRLDKDTTGAILFAKHALSHAVLDQMLEQRKIERVYYALVEGSVQKNQAIINQPIGRDRHHQTRRRVSRSGQHAVTHYKVLTRLSESKMTLLECSLETGRTHQIRVHLSEIGHPLIGDQLYGGKAIIPRQALHARRLAFIHPFTLERIECSAPFIDKPPIFPSFIT